MEEFPRFTDLRAMGLEISNLPEYRRVGTAIDKAARAQSCVSDLAEAETCLEALDDILGSIRRSGTKTRLATEAALLRTAVTLYERATAAGTKKGERGSIQIADRLSADQLQDHDALVELRHRSFAHVYPGAEIDGNVWHHEVLFMIEQGGPWKTAFSSRRIQFHGEIFRRLKRQVPVALALVEARFHERLEQISEILQENPLPLAVFERHVFNPVEKFGSKAAVESILDGQARGRASFLA
jgi:hypothetical protein